MRKRIHVMTLCLLAAAARGADDDEARFKPQAYKPGKDLRARAYAEKPYAVSERAAARPVGAALDPDQVRQAAVRPFATNAPLNAKQIAAQPLAQADPFAQGDKQVHASTISPNKVAASIERKPYLVSTNRLGHTAFVPSEKPKGRDPMLQPRQGIKELPPDDAP